VEEARRRGQEVVDALSARGAAACINHTFSGASVCDALTALGQLRQPRDNLLVVRVYDLLTTYIRHQLCLCVTNCVYESRTIYMSPLSGICGSRVTTCSWCTCMIHRLCLCVTNYVYASRTMYTSHAP